MNASADFDLLDPRMSGVYFVGVDDLAPIASAAVDAALQVARIDLSGCADKNSLLSRIAEALHFPAHFGGNWDALEDCLRDLSWLPASGYVLLFIHADALRAGAEEDFEVLLDILADVATDAGEDDLPWHAFVALPDSDFEDAARDAARD